MFSFLKDISCPDVVEIDGVKYEVNHKSKSGEYYYLEGVHKVGKKGIKNSFHVIPVDGMLSRIESFDGTRVFEYLKKRCTGVFRLKDYYLDESSMPKYLTESANELVKCMTIGGKGSFNTWVNSMYIWEVSPGQYIVRDVKGRSSGSSSSIDVLCDYIEDEDGEFWIYGKSKTY